MKKIIVGIFALAFMVLGSQNVSAANLWNSASNDCPTLAVANFTTNVGFGDPCWPLTSVSANEAETVNLRIYYHNASDLNGSSQTATNVRVLLTAPSGSSSTHSFSAQIVSDQGSLSSGSVSVNLPSSGTLSFGSTRWYPNQTQQQASFLNGQTGAEVSNGSGLSIGSIAPGWSSQGSVVVSYRVNSINQSNCTISNFTANGSQSTTITSGNAVNLVWNTNGCTSVTVSGPNGNVSSNLSGSSTVYPTSSGTYTITASGSTGGTQTQTVFVNVNGVTNNCTITNFTVNGSTSTYISSGNAANFVWNTNGCTSVNVSGPSLSSSSLSGSQTTYPNSSATYTINAYGSNGSTVSQSVYVNMNSTVNSCVITNFSANGSNTTTIQSGNPVNLIWNTNGCTSASISGPGISSNTLSGSQTLYPSSNSNYTITAYGQNGGTQTQTVYVNVNTIIQPPINNTCAVTTVATNVTQNSATLNGLVSGSNGSSYFEYGTSVSLGSRTISRVGSGAFSEVISGLSQNTPYYFRFVSQCLGGLSFGRIEVFQTLGTTVVNTVRQVIVQGTTVIGTQSPIMLKIENRYQLIGLGDIVDYTVTYKNIGKSTLTRPVLQVIVPRGFTLINTSRGTYSLETNTLTVPLEDLLPGAEGVVFLQARVEGVQVGSAQIVTTAILVYTSPNGAQENAIAYVLNSPRDMNVLGASAFWSGFWGIGLIGWLLILILILLIILATRSYYRKSIVRTTSPITGHTTTTTNY